MNKFNRIFSIINLLLSTALITVTIFAWYTYVSTVDQMRFNILQIDSLVTLYEANDENYNGVPNLLEETNINKYWKYIDSKNGSFVDYVNKYYDESFSFNYLDQKYALSQDSEANLLNAITINNIAPSKIYCYKFELTNYISTSAKLTFSFEKETGITYNPEILKYFEVRLGIINNNKSIVFSDWTNLCDYDSETKNYSYKGKVLNPFINNTNANTFNDANGNIILPGTGTNNGRLDMWLQVKLKKELATPIQVDEESKIFALPKYRIKLETETNSE